MTTYTPISWEDGDKITAQQLNKIENSVGTFIVVGATDYTLDVTYEDLVNAVENGCHVTIQFEGSNGEWSYPLAYLSGNSTNNEYYAAFGDEYSGEYAFYAAAPDEYFIFGAPLQ